MEVIVILVVLAFLANRWGNQPVKHRCVCGHSRANHKDRRYPTHHCRVPKCRCGSYKEATLSAEQHQATYGFRRGW